MGAHVPGDLASPHLLLLQASGLTCSVKVLVQGVQSCKVVARLQGMDMASQVSLTPIRHQVLERPVGASAL